MLRSLTIVVLLLVAAMTVGCAMCACPDDYMGPVPASGFGFNDRAGSILQGVAPSDEVINAAEDQEILGAAPAGAVPAEATPDQAIPVVPAP